MGKVYAHLEDYTLLGANLLDINGVHRLEREIFPRDAYSRLELALQFLIPWSRNYKIVDAADQIVGFCSTLSNLIPGKPAWIMTLGIARAHQRKGLGGWLLAFAESQLRAGRVRLTVRAGNTPAITLYRNADYIHMRRIQRYYSGGEDGLVMEKRLG